MSEHHRSNKSKGGSHHRHSSRIASRSCSGKSCSTHCHCSRSASCSRSLSRQRDNRSASRSRSPRQKPEKTRRCSRNASCSRLLPCQRSNRSASRSRSPRRTLEKTRLCSRSAFRTCSLQYRGGTSEQTSAAAHRTVPGRDTSSQQECAHCRENLW